jgi:hypothetical protein
VCPWAREGEALQAPQTDQRTQRPSHASRRALSFCGAPFVNSVSDQIRGVLKFSSISANFETSGLQIRRREFIAGLGSAAASLLSLPLARADRDYPDGREND